MLNTLGGVADEASKLAQELHQRFYRHDVWEQLLERGERTLLDAALLRFYDRTLGFTSAAIKGSEHHLVEEQLSQHLVKLQKLDLWNAPMAPPDAPLLPALEAIANQLLVLADSNVLTFLIVQTFPFRFTWSVPHLKVLYKNSSGKDGLLRFIQLGERGVNLPKLCGARDIQLSERTRRRALDETILMLEMGGRFTDELALCLDAHAVPNAR